MTVAWGLAGCGTPPAPPPAKPAEPIAKEPAAEAEPAAPAPAAPAADPRATLADLAHWDAATSAARRGAGEWVGRRMPGFAFSRMETFSCGGQAHEVAIYSHAKTGLEFVLVPPGTFDMGLAPDDVMLSE